MLDEPRLEEVVNKIDAVVTSLLDKPPCAAGRSLAALYYQFLSKSLEGGNMSAQVCLKYLRDNLDALLTAKQPAFGTFLHSFAAQFASITLQLEVMSENSIRWMDSQDYMRIPIRSVDELLKILPCVKDGAENYAIENLTLNDDLMQLQIHHHPAKQFQEFYLSLIHGAILKDEGNSRLRLLEIQTAVNQVIKEGRGGFMHSFAKAWYQYQLKLRLWLTDFVETTEKPEFTDELRKRKLRQAKGGQRSLREVIANHRVINGNS
ncbi:MAG: hypothetical protein ACXAEU_13155 [Candidatus Hodarchaeales archaeon]